MGLCDYDCFRDEEILNRFCLVDPEFELQKLDAQIREDMFYDFAGSFFKKHAPIFYSMFSRD